MDFMPEDRAVKPLVPASGYLISRTHQAVQLYCLHHRDGAHRKQYVLPSIQPSLAPSLLLSRPLSPTYLPTHLPTHVLTGLPSCLPACLPVNQSIRPFIPITGQQPTYVLN